MDGGIDAFIFDSLEHDDFLTDKHIAEETLLTRPMTYWDDRRPNRSLSVDRAGCPNSDDFDEHSRLRHWGKSLNVNAFVRDDLIVDYLCGVGSRLARRDGGMESIFRVLCRPCKTTVAGERVG